MIRISVCMATYNGEKFIREQIDSILKQLASEDELIISDDGSIDNTTNIVKQYSDSRIKVYQNEKAKGYSSNFENALSKANGRYIFLTDQDDIWIDNKVEICMSKLIDEGYDMVISDCMIVDEKLNLIEDSYFRKRKSKPGFLNTLVKANYLGCCMSFHKSVLQKALPFPEKGNLAPHDLWIGLVGYAFFSSATLEDKLVMYRRHGENASDGGNSSITGILFKIKYRCYVIYNILKRVKRLSNN